MTSSGKYYGLLLIALYLFSPISGFAFASPVFHDNGLPGMDYSYLSSNATQPDQNLPTSEEQESNSDELNCSCFCHIPSIHLVVPYSPLTSSLETKEKYRILSGVYFSIFVPPQNLSWFPDEYSSYPWFMPVHGGELLIGPFFKTLSSLFWWCFAANGKLFRFERI